MSDTRKRTDASGIPPIHPGIDKGGVGSRPISPRPTTPPGATQRKRTDDLADLAQVAIRALSSALADGDGHHPPGSWMTETQENQLHHLRDHLTALLSSDDGEDHLGHIICRAVILRALKESR